MHLDTMWGFQKGKICYGEMIWRRVFKTHVRKCLRFMKDFEKL
jgi:hypothetical protein